MKWLAVCFCVEPKWGCIVVSNNPQCKDSKPDLQRYP